MLGVRLGAHLGYKNNRRRLGEPRVYLDHDLCRYCLLLNANAAVSFHREEKNGERKRAGVHVESEELVGMGTCIEVRQRGVRGRGEGGLSRAQLVPMDIDGR